MILTGSDTGGLEMEITDSRIDGGKAFDWGRTSADYARYRDIYPEEFYDRVIKRGLCTAPQRVLDLGTGTGVLPRALYRYGAKWTAADISGEQIAQARAMSEGMDIEYIAAPAEELDLPAGYFDVITACQCFWYFDHKTIAPKLYEMLKPNGALLILYMAWLPFEDRIAGASEELVLKYSPRWNGCGETMHPIEIPPVYSDGFELVHHEEYPIAVHFTRESWNGRMKACRGVGASLTADEIAAWEREHLEQLARTAPEGFDVKHYAAIAELRKK